MINVSKQTYSLKALLQKKKSCCFIFSTHYFPWALSQRLKNEESCYLKLSWIARFSNEHDFNVTVPFAKIRGKWKRHGWVLCRALCPQSNSEEEDWRYASDNCLSIPVSLVEREQTSLLHCQQRTGSCSAQVPSPVCCCQGRRKMIIPLHSKSKTQQLSLFIKAMRLYKATSLIIVT